MIINMTGGGSGGAALNFKVVPGLTQPGTAAENTIWVKVEKIASWYFSATQPENMADYDVWFQTGTSSRVEFNALKKNSIQVYPLSARQYNGGNLTAVDAMSYQNGEWVSWIPYLYNDGVGIEDFTLGTYNYESTSVTYSATDKGSYVNLHASGRTITSSSPAGASMTTKEKVDLSAYKKLKVRRTVNAMTAPEHSGLLVAVGKSINSAGVIVVEPGYLLDKTAPGTTNDVVELDISTFTEAMFIQLNAHAQSTSVSTIDVDIHEIWFE